MIYSSPRVSTTEFPCAKNKEKKHSQNPNYKDDNSGNLAILNVPA